jgi:hypothetical protein
MITDSEYNNKETGSFTTNDIHTDAGEVQVRVANDIASKIPINQPVPPFYQRARITWVLEYTDPEEVEEQP